MATSQSAFTIQNQLSENAGPLQKNASPDGSAHQKKWNVVLGLHILKNLTEIK